MPITTPPPLTEVHAAALHAALVELNAEINAAYEKYCDALNLNIGEYHANLKEAKTKRDDIANSEAFNKYSDAWYTIAVQYEAEMKEAMTKHDKARKAAQNKHGGL